MWPEETRWITPGEAMRPCWGSSPPWRVFKAFQAALRPNLAAPPNTEHWDVVGCSYDP